MRAAGARRQELSLHACKRLFFDLGVRPSLAAVRDLTQTGSASDIPKDIDHFWERIRGASKVRVASGSIPKALEDRAGELLGALFEEAVSHARTSLEDERAKVKALIAEAEQKTRDAEIRRDVSDEAARRAEARVDSALDRIRTLEAQLANTSGQHHNQHEGLQHVVRRFEADNEALQKRLDTEQTTNATLRDRVDELHRDLRHSTEHYAQQIKDAVAQAERRVKPMLVELDSLRSMATTYQSGVRDASRKEFDFIQQLAAAKARGDRFEVQLHEQADEIDALTRELDTLRGHQNLDPAIAALLCELASAGRLSVDELARVGTIADGHVALPARCPRCDEGEPELSQVDGQYEVLCPDCEHSSGTGDSRLEAVVRFMANGELSPSAAG